MAGEWINSINAMTQVVSGYLAEDEKQKEKEKKEKNRKRLEETLNQPDVIITHNSDGTISVKNLSREEIAKGQKAQIELSQIQKIQQKQQQGIPLEPWEQFMLSGYKKPAPTLAEQYDELTNQQGGLINSQRKPLFQPGVDYTKMSEMDLFNKVQSGDSGARQEAIRRGYLRK